MANGRVFKTRYGYVASDDAGWTGKTYATEDEARAAVGLPSRAELGLPPEEDDDA